MRKGFLLTCLFVIGFLTFCVSIALAEEKRAGVDALIQEALEKNPEVLAAKKKVQAYAEKIPQASALEDPMLGFGIVNLPTNFSFSEEDMTMKEISISQKLPFPGKRPLMRETAEKEAEAVSKEVTEKSNDIVKEVKNVYWELSHVYRTTEVTQRNKGILESLASIAETRYSVGEGIQQDVLKARVEISRMVDDLIMLGQKKTALEARLCSLLNRSGECGIGEPEELVFRKFPIRLQELQNAAVNSNPTLGRMKNMIEAREKEHGLAKLDYYPDFRVRFAYGQRDDAFDRERRDMLTGMVEVNVPIFYKSRQQPKVAEVMADVRKLKAQYDAMKNEIFYMIANMSSMVERNERQLELYSTGILPQASAQVKSAISAYTVGKVDFFTLLDSQITLYRYEIEYHGALTDYEKNLAGLEAAVGERFQR